MQNHSIFPKSNNELIEPQNIKEEVTKIFGKTINTTNTTTTKSVFNQSTIFKQVNVNSNQENNNDKQPRSFSKDKIVSDWQI